MKSSCLLNLFRSVTVSFFSLRYGLDLECLQSVAPQGGGINFKKWDLVGGFIPLRTCSWRGLWAPVSSSSVFSWISKLLIAYFVFEWKILFYSIRRDFPPAMLIIWFVFGHISKKNSGCYFSTLLILDVHWFKTWKKFRCPKWNKTAIPDAVLKEKSAW